MKKEIGTQREKSEEEVETKKQKEEGERRREGRKKKQCRNNEMSQEIRQMTRFGYKITIKK